MSETHVVSALRTKRSELSGLIIAAERQLKQFRADLAHIDATIRLFDGSADPELIRPKRPYRSRMRYFAKGELSRLCLSALRHAGGVPVRSSDIAAAVMREKGLDTDDGRMLTAIGNQVSLVLSNLAKRSVVERDGVSSGTRWRVA